LADWSFDYYTSISDSSDPPWYDDNLKFNHGNRGQRDSFDTRKTRLDKHGNARNFKTCIDKERHSFDQDPIEPVIRKTEPPSAFDQSFKMSMALPVCNPYGNNMVTEGQGIDVYKLLRRSQAQEERLAELQMKLFGSCDTEECHNSSSFSAERSQCKDELHTSSNRSSRSYSALLLRRKVEAKRESK